MLDISVVEFATPSDTQSLGHARFITRSPRKSLRVQVGLSGVWQADSESISSHGQGRNATRGEQGPVSANAQALRIKSLRKNTTFGVSTKGP